MALSKFWRALTENSAQTSEEAADPRLLGRTYHIPFATVWDQIVAMIESHPRWTLIRADEGTGLIYAQAKTRVLRFVDDVRFKIKLDQNALTRVDMWSTSQSGRSDLGANTRRIGRFYRDLDSKLGLRLE